MYLNSNILLGMEGQAYFHVGEWKSVDVMALDGGWDVVFPLSLDSGSGKEQINQVGRLQPSI